MKMKLILAVVVGLAAGAIAAVSIIPQAREAILPSGGPRTSGKALIGGPFSLVDQNGTRVTEKDFRDRYMLVFFGFTSCPDICPAGLQLVAGALDKLGEKADRVVPVFITVDPERDTPAKLGEYVGNFDSRFVGLTGTPEEIAKAAKAYRVYYKKVPNADLPDDYSIDHTSIFYLMDPNGEFVTHFSPTTPVEEMAAKLDKAL
ncbi:MAG: SCO family protein [Hyphomicrobium sp.]|jgi:protein SCO1/2